MYLLSAEKYKTLYAKYLGATSHSADQLLDEARFQEGETVFDLCAGVLLRVSRAAWARGAKTIVATDPIFASRNPLEDDNLPWEDSTEYLEHLEFTCYEDTHKIYLDPHEVQFSLRNFQDAGFDVVVCQQGINYWFEESEVEALVKTMKKGSRFVFNTFYKQPPTYPDWKTYNIDGKIYGEAFYMVDGMVHHLQMREGIAPHYTIFKWLPRESFHVLHKYFLVSRITEGNTDIYCCTLK